MKSFINQDPVVICTCLVLIHLMEADASDLKL